MEVGFGTGHSRRKMRFILTHFNSYPNLERKWDTCTCTVCLDEHAGESLCYRRSNPMPACSLPMVDLVDEGSTVAFISLSPGNEVLDKGQKRCQASRIVYECSSLFSRWQKNKKGWKGLERSRSSSFPDIVHLCQDPSFWGEGLPHSLLPFGSGNLITLLGTE